jgi:hypothetical protein
LRQSWSSFPLGRVLLSDTRVARPVKSYLTFHGIFFVQTGGGRVGRVGRVGRWRESLGIKEDGRKRKREKVF